MLAPVCLACVWLGGTPWAVLMVVAAVGLGDEWAGMCGRPGGQAARVAVLVALGLAALLGVAERPGAAAGVAAVGMGLAWLLSRGGRLPLGVLYLSVPVVCLAWLRDGDALRDGVAGRVDVVFLLVVVWASDIGAYAVGRLAGGPRLAPSISPGKTWSGAAGGLVAAMLAGEAAARVLAPAPVGQAAAVACALGVASQAGDLLESWIKRRFGVKDSGWLIPGHGGLLDRLDGLLAAAVAACILLNTGLLGRGGVLWK